MEEIRIDVTKQTPEELALANENAQLIFRFNHTMPATAEYDELMHCIFPTMKHFVMLQRNLIYTGITNTRQENLRTRRHHQSPRIRHPQPDRLQAQYKTQRKNY
ncbi:MAG: hypothetical protein K2J49_02155 [Muribaculaceae bacterium]|nr:hypothetical protein [Muribaculaceae bacterium]